MVRGVPRLIVLLISILGVSSLAYAQGSSTKATLTGVVQDSTGAVIPGASVVVRNVATGVKTETVSNSTGAFSVPALDAGTYDATVSLTGFKTVVVDKIGLTAGNTASIGTVKLDVGQASETVNVSAHTELIDTSSTTVSATMSIAQLQELPLVTKNAMYAATLLPGVNTPSGSHSQRSSTVLGLPQSALAIVVDGVNVQDQVVKSTDGFYADIRPQTDAVEQMTVSEGTPGADSSGQGAVQIKFVTRSGTNASTGSAYEYFRDTPLNSNSYFNKLRGQPKNAINWNQFGIRQGGPIVIPGVYDGKNKAFYFVNYEEFRLPVTQSTTRTVLSPLAQTGVLQYGCAVGTGCAHSVNVLQLAQANGQVAAIDPTVQAFFNAINQGTTLPGFAGVSTPNVDLNTYSFAWQPPMFRAEHLPVVRIDMNLGKNSRLTGTNNFQKANSDPDIVNNGFSSFPGIPVDSTQYSYRETSTISLRTTLGSHLVNEGGWGLITSPVYFSANVTPDRYINNTNFGFPAVGGATPSNIDVVTNSTSRNGANYNFHDTLTWLKGAHNFSMGATYTNVWEWSRSHPLVNTYTLGLDTANDPAAGLFTAANFPGSASADLASARNLYALLTGRVTTITGNAILQPDGSYLYRADTYFEVKQPEFGTFIQDQWRLRPNVTVNAGVRYELQYPIRPTAALFSRNDVSDLCGQAGTGAAANNAPEATIGCPFGIPGIPLNGSLPTYKQYTANSPGYTLDKNNFAPSIGVAWQPNVQSGFLRSILGDPNLATVRASWARSFNQGGLADYTGTLQAGPGLTVNANRTAQNQNLVLPGESWPLLLSQTNRLGGPAACPPDQNNGCIPNGITFPVPIVFSTGVTLFDPNYQTEYTDSWSVGLQRALSKDMSVEIRYLGNKDNAIATTENYNEQDIYNAGFGSSSNFIDEFTKAQHNLAANIAANKGATFAFTGAPGTQPLPIFLASYTGKGPGSASDPAAYTGANWTNSTSVNALSLLAPSIGTFASTNTTNGLFGNTTFRANGIAAGMPANFWVLNPAVASDNLRTAEGFTKYHTLQILVNRRLSHGLSFNANYAYQVAYGSSLDTLFKPRALLRTTNAVPHAYKLTAIYELPFGRGKRYGANWDGLVNGIAGGWQVSMTGRWETGRLFDIGDTKLVGITLDQLQKEYKYYVNPADNQVYMLPQALIANTVKAFSIDATSPTGHPLCTGSNDVTCGGPDPSQPYLAPSSDANCTRIIAGDCNVRQQLLKAPLFSRFDFSAKKRIAFAHSASFDLEVDVLNVFNAIDFNSVFTTSTSPDSYRVTSAYQDINQSYDPGGRIGQLVFRVNW
jgi:hypothetical protein